MTLMRYRGRTEGANVSDSKGQLMKTAGSERIKARGRREMPPVDEINERGCTPNELQGGAPA